MEGVKATMELNFDLDYIPRPDPAHAIPIAIIGAGGIVQAAHLPAYRKANFRVAGIYDQDMSKAERVAVEFGIPKVYRTLDELLADEVARIVDIAVPASVQAQIAPRVAAAGKHMLCQKPLADTYVGAVEIVRAAKAAGVKAAVNQNMRWDPAIQATRTIIRRGWLGEPVSADVQVNVWTPWHLWPWILETPRLEVMYHSIHYLDAIRYLFGDPVRVYARGLRHPNQKAKAETRTTVILEYDSEFQGLVHDTHNNWETDPDDWYATFRFEGGDGTVKGRIGALYDYPVGRPDTLEFRSRQIDPTYWFRPRLDGKWFPDAFVGPMAELMRAVAENVEPENSVRDNLVTLQTVFATYRSMDEQRPVRLGEIAAEAPSDE